MGCWSESCAISGMEIQCGAPVYGLTIDKLYGETIIRIPPTLGEYDDYGGIDLLEDMHPWPQKSGENWTPGEEKKGRAVFIDAQVFDFLPSLEIDFQRDGINTIEDEWQRHRQTIAARIEQNIRRREKYGANTEFYIGLMGLHEVFGYTDRCMIGASQWFEKRLNAGAMMPELEAPLDRYGRAFKLLHAFRELRKAPSADIRGPQHGGHFALLPFYRKVIELTEARQKETP